MGTCTSSADPNFCTLRKQFGDLTNAQILLALAIHKGDCQLAAGTLSRWLERAGSAVTVSCPTGWSNYTIDEIDEACVGMLTAVQEPWPLEAPAALLVSRRLQLLRTADNRLWLRKEYTAGEAWRSRAYCHMHAEAGLSVAPLVVAVEASKELGITDKQAGVFVSWAAGRDTFRIMAEASAAAEKELAGCNPRDLFEIAVLDTLTGSYRHGGNLILCQGGHIRVIDHEYSFSGSTNGNPADVHDGKICGPVLGRTMLRRWSFLYQDLIDPTDISRHLDYEARYGLVEHEIGSGATALASKISRMSVLELSHQYGIPLDRCGALHTRCTSMHQHGLESTIDKLVARRDEIHFYQTQNGCWKPSGSAKMRSKVKCCLGFLTAVAASYSWSAAVEGSSCTSQSGARVQPLFLHGETPLCYHCAKGFRPEKLQFVGAKCRACASPHATDIPIEWNFAAAAAKAARSLLWSTPQVFECLIANAGVAYRFSPVFADKNAEGKGPNGPNKFLIGTEFVKSENNMTFLKCSTGRGWLPMTNLSGSVQCFRHVGAVGEVDTSGFKMMKAKTSVALNPL